MPCYKYIKNIRDRVTKMERKYHYVYRITNLKINKHYYGMRSSLVEPKNDIGILYFSSSSDAAFILDQKSNPQDYRYKVVQQCETRKDAVILECQLHRRYSVHTSSSFYNKAMATLTSAIIAPGHSEQTKEKQSIAGKGRGSYRNIHTNERKRMYADDIRLQSGNWIPWALGQKYSLTNEQRENRKGKNNGMFAKGHSENTKSKISEKSRKKYIDNPALRAVSRANALKAVASHRETRDRTIRYELYNPTGTLVWVGNYSEFRSTDFIDAYVKNKFIKKLRGSVYTHVIEFNQKSSLRAFINLGYEEWLGYRCIKIVISS